MKNTDAEDDGDDNDDGDDDDGQSSNGDEDFQSGASDIDEDEREESEDEDEDDDELDEDEDVEYWTSGGRTRTGRTVPLSSLVAAAAVPSAEDVNDHNGNDTSQGSSVPNKSKDSMASGAQVGDSSSGSREHKTPMLTESEAEAVRIASSQRASFEGRIRFASERSSMFTTV